MAGEALKTQHSRELNGSIFFLALTLRDGAVFALFVPAGAALGADDNHATAFTAIFIGRHVVGCFFLCSFSVMLLSDSLVAGCLCGGFLFVSWRV